MSTQKTDLKPFEFAGLEEMIEQYNLHVEEIERLREFNKNLFELIAERVIEQYDVRRGDLVAIEGYPTYWRERGMQNGNIVRVDSIQVGGNKYGGRSYDYKIDSGLMPQIRGRWKLKSGGWSNKPISYTTYWVKSDAEALQKKNDEAKRLKAEKKLKQAASELGIDPDKLAELQKADQ